MAQKTLSEYDPEAATSYGVGAMSAVHLMVSGLQCGACAAAVEKALARVEGVGFASVSRATGKARVVVNASIVRVGSLLEAVRDAGFTAHVLAEGDVEGLEGAEEEASRCKLIIPELEKRPQLEAFLKQIPGISVVMPIPAYNEVRVVFRPALTSASKIFQAVKDAGFPVEGVSSGASQQVLLQVRGIGDSVRGAGQRGLDRMGQVLQGVLGVQSVSVRRASSSSDGIFAVTFDPHVTGPRALIDKLDGLGGELEDIRRTADGVGNGDGETDGAGGDACSESGRSDMSSVGPSTSEKFRVSLLDREDEAGTVDSSQRRGLGGWQCSWWGPRRRLGRVGMLQWMVVLAASFSVPVLLLAQLLPRVYPCDQWLAMPLLNQLNLGMVLEWTYATPVFVFCGWVFFQQAFLALKNRSASFDLQVAVGMSMCYLYSCACIVVAAMSAPGTQAPPRPLFEAGALLTTLLLAAKLIEESSRVGALRHTLSLLDTTPRTATLLVFDPEGKEVIGQREIDVRLVQEGDVILVSPGSLVPVDGVVTWGTSLVNEGTLSGDPIPVRRTVGDNVSMGTRNGVISALRMRATRGGKGAAQARLAVLLEATGEGGGRAPLVKYANQVQALFVPVVVFLSLAVFVVWLVLGLTGVVFLQGAPVGPLAFGFSLSTLLIASASALALGAPCSLHVARGMGADRGVVYKNGWALEEMSQVSCVVFSKTGTLTTGRLNVSLAQAFGNAVSLEKMLWLAASAEAKHAHPIAEAVVDHYKFLGYSAEGGVSPPSFPLRQESARWSQSGGIPGTPPPPDHWEMPALSPAQPDRPEISSEVSDVEELRREGSEGGEGVPEGNGVSCVVEGHRVAVGGWEIMDSQVGLQGMPHRVAEAAAAFLRVAEEQGGRALLVCVDGQVAGGIAVTDSLTSEARAVVADLKGMGVRCILATQEHGGAARIAGEALGIAFKDVLAEASQEAKVEKIREMQAKGYRVAMVGNGVQDAAPLVAADIGVATGQGSDAAIEAADVILVTDSLNQLVPAIRIPSAAIRHIALAYVWEGIYNVAAVPLAAGVLFVPFGLDVPPWLASTVLGVFSVLVVLLSLSLRLKHF